MLSPGTEIIIPCLKDPYTLCSQPRPSQQWREHTLQNFAVSYLSSLRSWKSSHFSHSSPKEELDALFLPSLNLADWGKDAKKSRTVGRGGNIGGTKRMAVIPSLCFHSHSNLKPPPPNLQHCRGCGIAAFRQIPQVPFVWIYYPKTSGTLDIMVLFHYQRSVPSVILDHRYPESKDTWK